MKTRNGFNLSMGFALLLSTACSGGGDGDGGGGTPVDPATAVAGSCFLGATDTCQEFVGPQWAQLPEIPCGGGIADPNACPRENAIGRCSFLEMAGNFDSIQYYYEGSIHQEQFIENLKQACASANGSFEEL